MSDLMHVTAGDAVLELAPWFGGGIARLDVAGRPVLRPWNGDRNDPFTLASNILVPFSNRISAGGFTWGGRRYTLSPNLEGEPLPLHGDGFQRTWKARQNGSEAEMTLDAGGLGPWRYRAIQRFDLTETALNVVLNVTNIGPETLPFGCGFHPWFPRTAETHLTFSATAVWMKDADNAQTEKRMMEAAPEWDFAQGTPLPQTRIDNGYEGWPGTADIRQGADAVSCRVTASPELASTVVYSPDGQADFFCFEPVSHPIDAFNLEGQPGLHPLSPGGTLEVGMTIRWGGP